MARTRRRYSTGQIVVALKQVELGLPIADLTRQMGITEQTYYRWSEAERNRSGIDFPRTSMLVWNRIRFESLNS